ncbi:MAG: M24 family metallopeptidase [Solirubrobacterales bacterium]
MTAILLFADTERSAAMRHEIPLAIPDPFLYAELDGRRAAVVNVLERDRIAAVAPDVELLDRERFGYDELIGEGRSAAEADVEVVVRACAQLGIRRALVPDDYPLGLADRLRADGVDLVVDTREFEHRRRGKNEVELAGIRRAQGAADAGMAAVADLLREARPDGEVLRGPSDVLTAEAVRARVREVCARRGAPAPPDVIVAPGAQGAAGHEPGSGPLAPRTPIIVDIWPWDERSGCYADMTRTFVVGDPSPETAEQHRLTLEALRLATAALRPGVPGVAVYDAACGPFEAAGQPTKRTAPPGEPLRDGFYHGLGHGVGLEVHEPPRLARGGRDELVAGDVVTVEPGCYRFGHGGVRLEDLLLITADGAERLTDYPYDLRP